MKWFGCKLIYKTLNIFVTNELFHATTRKIHSKIPELNTEFNITTLSESRNTSLTVLNI